MAYGLQGRKVLVVEDEYFIADDVQRVLEAAGAIVVGPTASCDEGLQLIEADPPDLAILDINLRGIMAYDVADRLAARGIPFVFATGYATESLPDKFHGVPSVTKPYDPGVLVATLIGLDLPGR